MPVTLNTASHPSRRWTESKASDIDAFLSDADRYSGTQRHRQSLVQSSFDSHLFQEGHITSSRNGLVYAAYHAYSGHHHLTLRPEDLWFSVLVQLGFYVNAHAEELRSFFVAHEGQKHLEVYSNVPDFGRMAYCMTSLIEKEVLDPELRAFIMPSFTTTTESDRVVASILMMGAMQSYFTYGMCVFCGIPSVTLLGEREDWQQILTRLDVLSRLGPEPEEFASLLRPIVRRFIASFDDPTSPDILDFWGRIVHRNGGSGTPTITGWITAFCFWDEGGVRARRSGGPTIRDWEGLDGVQYLTLDLDLIPLGFSSVPVSVNNNGDVYDAVMMAGSPGIQATSSGQMLDASGAYIVPNRRGLGADRILDPPTEEPGLDSLQPMWGWWMYRLPPPVENRAEALGVRNTRDNLLPHTSMPAAPTLHKNMIESSHYSSSHFAQV